MKIVAGIVGGLFVAVAVSSVLGVMLGAFVDSPPAGSTAQVTSPASLLLLAIWAGFIIWAARRARGQRRVWGATMLWLGLSAFAAPIATLVFSAGYAARVDTTSPGTAAGVAVGGGLLTIAAGFVGFFLGLLFLVPAYFLLRGGRGEPTKRCPRCAEPILKAATMCRHCSYDFNTQTPAAVAP